MKNFFGTIWDFLIKIWNFVLWEIQNDQITVQKVVIAGIVIFAGFIVAKRASRFLKFYLSQKSVYSKHTISTFEKIIYYFLIITFVFLALYIVHIPLTTFTFLGGALAVGFGFGAQNIINNFISGFIIMSEKPVKVGDVVEVEGEVGTIEDIGARCTRLLTCENIHKLIPNSMLLEKTVTNWTHTNADIRIHVPIGIAYGSDVRKAADIMLHAIKQCPGILSNPEPYVLFRGHGDSTLNFEAYLWAQVTTMTQRLQFESEVNFLLNEHLTKANIEIAFPQMDVHLTAMEPLRVTTS